MVLRHTPVIDYVPHSIRREIIIAERARHEKGLVVSVTNIMNHYAVSKSAAESLYKKITEESNV